MENINVILLLLATLGLGSSAIHYSTSRKIQAKVPAKNKKDPKDEII